MPYTIQATVGHVQLPVTDLERSAAFYRDVVGLHETQRLPGAVFLSASDYHHHVALNTWGGIVPQPVTPTDGHVAFLLASPQALADAIEHVLDSGWPIWSAERHGSHDAIYFNDPDGHGLELTCDHAPEDWPRDARGGLAMYRKAVAVEELVARLRDVAPTATPA